MNADPDKIDVRLRTGVDQIDRVNIHCKIQNGDDLTRDDLHMILRALEDGIASDWAQSMTCAVKELPKRIKGYKVKGQGRKLGISILNNSAYYRNIKIADDYFELRKNHTEAEAVFLLESESYERYGKKFKYKSLPGLINKGKKSILALENRALSDLYLTGGEGS